MYCAKEFFEKLIDTGELKEYLFDAFERHSHLHHADQDEQTHIMEIKDSVVAALSEHSTNKAVSHEMWAVVTLVSQFERANATNTRAPGLLGERVYNDPAFLEAFHEVRTYLSSQPVLLRA